MNVIREEYIFRTLNFSEKYDWKKIEKNYVTTKQQVILLMFPNGEGREDISERQQWHYLAVKKTISIIKLDNIKK